MRAPVALAAAYALALQSILFALGSAGAVASGMTPLCSTFSAHVPGSAPTDRGTDCLGICLTGCCCGNAALPQPGLAPGYAPDGALAFAATPAATPQVSRRPMRANRSRAPPVG